MYMIEDGSKTGYGNISAGASLDSESGIPMGDLHALFPYDGSYL